MTKDEVISLLREHSKTLEQMGVKSLALFGSVARGEAEVGSDIDLLVDFSRPVGLFEFVRVKTYLESILGKKVDLVTRDALKPQLRDKILREAIVAR